MRALSYQLRQLSLHYTEPGSGKKPVRQNQARWKALAAIADDLDVLGYRLSSPNRLKQQHVDALVAHWQACEVSVSTLKKRLSHLRWWAAQVGCPSVIAADNRAYLRIDQHVRADQCPLDYADKLLEVGDTHAQMSQVLQGAFGLTHAESILIKVRQAWQGDHWVIAGRWRDKKHAKDRIVRVHCSEQQRLAEQMIDRLGEGAVIPPDRTYIEQSRVVQRWARKLKLCSVYAGLAQYTRWRYHQLCDSIEAQEICQANGNTLPEGEQRLAFDQLHAELPGIPVHTVEWCLDPVLDGTRVPFVGLGR